MLARWSALVLLSLSLFLNTALAQSSPEIAASAAPPAPSPSKAPTLRPAARIVAATFKSGLLRSRNTARENSQPIPPDIRAGLAPFFPQALLDSVRYTIGDVSPDGLAGFAIRNGNAAAVTLVDTIVFRQSSHVSDLSLWAHELHHVEQYRSWGVDGFASRYAFSWNQVEAEARDRAAAFRAWRTSRPTLVR